MLFVHQQTIKVQMIIEVFATGCQDIDYMLDMLDKAPEYMSS